MPGFRATKVSRESLDRLNVVLKLVIVVDCLHKKTHSNIINGFSDQFMIFQRMRDWVREAWILWSKKEKENDFEAKLDKNKKR